MPFLYGSEPDGFRLRLGESWPGVGRSGLGPGVVPALVAIRGCYIGQGISGVRGRRRIRGGGGENPAIGVNPCAFSLPLCTFVFPRFLFQYAINVILCKSYLERDLHTGIGTALKSGGQERRSEVMSHCWFQLPLYSHIGRKLVGDETRFGTFDLIQSRSVLYLLSLVFIFFILFLSRYIVDEVLGPKFASVSVNRSFIALVHFDSGYLESNNQTMSLARPASHSGGVDSRSPATRGQCHADGRRLQSQSFCGAGYLPMRFHIFVTHVTLSQM